MTIPDEVERAAREMSHIVAAFAAELRKYWRFDDRQMHAHTWHTREDFIEQVLPKLLAAQRLQARAEISEAMVEAAATKLSKMRCDGCENDGWLTACVDPPCSCRRFARAALAAALSGKEE